VTHESARIVSATRLKIAAFLKIMTWSFFYFGFCQASFGAIYPPGYDWQTLKSKYFDIHFDKSLKAQAPAVAEIADRVYDDVCKEMKWKPYWRPDIILLDNVDFANGGATPIPFNTMLILIPKPEMNSIIGNYKNWLELLLYHEFTHIIQGDAVRGIPSVSRYLLGRFWFPGFMQPGWIIEGYATYHETMFTGFGRTNSTYTNMILRTAVENNDLRHFSEAGNYSRRWPAGATWYIYGSAFIDYIDNRLGRILFFRVKVRRQSLRVFLKKLKLEIV